MNRVQHFMKKNSNVILTVFGSVGVITTSILAVKATPKAMKLIDEAKIYNDEELTVMETIKVAWKPYIPAVLTGVSTIACIFGINYLSHKNQASLMSAYALLDNSYKEYKNKVNELYGENANTEVRNSIVDDHLEDTIEIEDEKMIFFDFQSMRQFTATMHHVMQAECAFLELLHNKGFASLNEYYSLLGIPPVSFGDNQGWFDMERIDPYHCEELEFHYDKAISKNGIEFICIDTNIPPSSDFIL